MFDRVIIALYLPLPRNHSSQEYALKENRAIGLEAVTRFEKPCAAARSHCDTFNVEIATQSMWRSRHNHCGDRPRLLAASLSAHPRHVNCDEFLQRAPLLFARLPLSACRGVVRRIATFCNGTCLPVSSATRMQHHRCFNHAVPMCLEGAVPAM